MPIEEFVRPAITSIPYPATVPGILDGVSFWCHRRVDGGCPGMKHVFFLEQRLLATRMGVADLVAKRKRDRQNCLLQAILFEWGLTPDHLSVPGEHELDSTKVDTFSVPFTIAWLLSQIEQMTKARKPQCVVQAKAAKRLYDQFFEEAARVMNFGDADQGPVIVINGANIQISNGFVIDMSSVCAHFPSFAAEWEAIREAGHGSQVPWPAGRPLLPACEVFSFLRSRCQCIAKELRPENALTKLRDALLQVTGSLIERTIAAAVVAASQRPSHQIGVQPIMGLTSKRRARRSSGDTFQVLALAEQAGHAASVLRASSGSGWLHSVATRMSQLLYNKKASAEFDPTGAAALCWDGTSIDGRNVHIGVCRNTLTSRGVFMKPKAFFYSFKRFVHSAGTTGKHKNTVLGIV